MLFKTVRDLVELAEKENKKISHIMIEQEMLVTRKVVKKLLPKWIKIFK